MFWHIAKFPELSLRPDEDRPAYDRLQAASPVTHVLDGPKVTVLVAAYEAADTLPTTLRSLRRQSWEESGSHCPRRLQPVAGHGCCSRAFCAERFPYQGGAYAEKTVAPILRAITDLT